VKITVRAASARLRAGTLLVKIYKTGLHVLANIVFFLSFQILFLVV